MASPLFSQAALASFVGACGNFSIQYNLSVLGLALAFASSHATSTAKGLSPDLPQPAWAKYSLLGMVFVGTMLGMVLLGYVGDAFGRRAGMLASLGLVVAGALASALLSWGPPDAAYGVIVVCRLVIGAGVGGIYPNAAAISAESADEDEDGGERVGWAFFWQAPGSIGPYVLGWILLVTTPASTPAVSSLLFRALLAFGALPAGAVWLASFWLASDMPGAGAVTDGGARVGGSGSGSDSGSGGGSGSGSGGGGGGGGGKSGSGGEPDGGKVAGSSGAAAETPLALALARPELVRTLIGTTSTWLLYDISYYGTAIFTPQILDSIFAGEATLVDLCWQAIVKEIAGLLGVLAAIAVMRRLGGRRLNAWGFVLLAALFALFGLLYSAAPGSSSAVKFAVFCALSFALNWGPNVATYCLPAQVFPREVRATFHGLSAASGKLGAIIGTFMFSPISAAFGVAVVMWVQVAVCLLGALLSVWLIPDNGVADAPVLWCGRFCGMGGGAAPSAAQGGAGAAGAGAGVSAARRRRSRGADGVGELVNVNPLVLDVPVAQAEAAPPTTSRPAGGSRRERMRAAAGAAGAVS